MIEYDVVILGAGISGLSASIYLKRAGLNTVIIENNIPGGQLSKGFDIENYPGFKKINSIDLFNNIYDQVSNLNIEILECSIKNIDLENKIVELDNKKIKSRYIVIATGRKERRLNLYNEDRLIGNGISFCATCDGNFYKDRDVVVVGGGNSAITEALYLSNICKSVKLVCRSNILKGEKILIDRLNNRSNISVIYNSNIIKYNITNNKLDSILLDSNDNILCDGIFMEVGFIPNSEMFNVDKDNGYIIVNDKYESSITNIYAIGDIIYKELYQLSTAIGDAAICSHNIIKDYNK